MAFLQAVAHIIRFSCEFKKSDHMVTNISWLQDPRVCRTAVAIKNTEFDANLIHAMGFS